MEYFIINILVSVFCIALFMFIFLRLIKSQPPKVQNHDFFKNIYYFQVPHTREEIIRLLSVSSDGDPVDYRLTHKLEPELWILERLWITGTCAYEYALIFEETADGCRLTLQHLVTHFQIRTSSYDPYYDEINALMIQKLQAEPLPING